MTIVWHLLLARNSESDLVSEAKHSQIGRTCGPKVPLLP